MKYSQYVNPKNVPQSQALPGTNQKRNNAGGYAFELDKWKRLDRFLILGTEGPTYYASERKMTLDNIDNLVACIQENGVRVVDTIVAISDAGRAPKNDPAVFALAVVASKGNEAAKAAAFAALPKVARIGTHLFAFAEALKGMRGWSKAVSRAFKDWYLNRQPKSLAMQLIKYQQRNGWSHRDLLRLSHVKPNNAETEKLLRWAVKGNNEVVGENEPEKDGLKLIWAFEKAKTAKESELIKIIDRFSLPWEAIPTEKRTSGVWNSLLPSMKLGALLRNLGNISSHGVLGPGKWSANDLVINKLTNAQALKEERIHPLSVLLALTTYSRGHGIKGDKSWSVDGKIKDALNDAFYKSFGAVEPSGKRFLLGIDVSGSMTVGNIAGLPGITPNVAAAAMAMVTYRTEPKSYAFGFTNTFRDLGISPNDSLEVVTRKTQNASFGSTDCSVPMQHALSNKMEVDAFIVLTDNETWHGSTHPCIALETYRQKMGIPAKLIVIGMTATQFSIARPDDPNSLDVVGMDTAVPNIIREFVS